MTDSKQLFDALTRGKNNTERRLSIIIAAAREAYQKLGNKTAGLIATESNRSDSLSKAVGNGALKIMQKIDNTDVVEWIVRETADKEEPSKCERSKYSFERNTCSVDYDKSLLLRTITY